MAQTEHNIRLTSAEMANLWTSYISDSSFNCVFKHFLTKVEDKEIRPILEYGLKLTEKHLSTLKQILHHEDFPIPHGFTEEDVTPDAPRLFSDSFFLHYLSSMGRSGLLFNAVAISTAARSDVFDFYNECLASSAEVLKKSREVLLSKGLFIRPPYIPIPKEVEFIQSSDKFFGGFFIDKRPLTAMEISHLNINIQTNSIGKALIMGYSQVAKTDEIRKYFLRGKEISKKHIEIFSSILTKEDLPAPMTWDGDVMESKVAPFSEKLMMYQVVALCAAGLGNYGSAIASSPRHDLATNYGRLSAEIGKYGEEGARIIISNNWMEQPPIAIDRKALTT
ncbi:hypothetical protein FHS18_001662 [Paenibacillus phyllosphaerae]|uniref:DUF3231 family protein n=1 Tax=Paenibacillus phyllosphaerae TaxID=274593 RepID=A0A7W5AW66_9BACL|nr:DUF3231 family protein [Paenibacillus phyllosphaerae]MBB3109599.1 hypothetical protein [Paenibacillus phyllosphaerae]